jgi:hypothetical protein
MAAEYKFTPLVYMIAFVYCMCELDTWKAVEMLFSLIPL